MLRVLGCLVLAGCNQVFGLDATKLTDGGALDGDLDGIPDASDNCPLVGNAEQGDRDGDLVGDACDNCPLISNPDQRALGDGDAIGDMCDPRPAQDGDCLVLLDLFSDPDAFAMHWQSRPATPAPAIVAQPGSVALDPPDDTLVTMIVLGDDGQPLPGIYDVVLTGSLEQERGILGAAATLDAPYDDVYTCSIQNGATVALDMPGVAWLTGLSVDHLTPEIAIRITVRDPAALRPTVDCRVDYGVGVGTLNEPSDLRASPGQPGITMRGDPFTLTGIAIYQQRSPCPDAIRR